MKAIPAPPAKLRMWGSGSTRAISHTTLSNSICGQLLWSNCRMCLMSMSACGLPWARRRNHGKEMSFADKVQSRQRGIVTYGITPPKVGTDPERLVTLATNQRERLRSIPIDAVIVYDIHDEGERNSNPRPFPYMQTLDGAEYSRDHLGDVGVPYIIFRCIAKYSTEQFQAFLSAKEAAGAVFVGPAASGQTLPFSMNDAFSMRGSLAPDLLVGGVAIPERHVAKGDEPLRCIRKQQNGTTFFITQCCYNVEVAKNFLSDYYYACREQGVPMVPVLITLSPCGSMKTLEFLRWLGVHVSKWLENDLVHNHERIVEESVSALTNMFRDLVEFARIKDIPIGCNIESLAIRKAEIDASLHLVSVARRILEATPTPPPQP